jgi:hypothetical protein
MKKQTIITVIVLFISIGNNIFAQESVPKAVLLNTLNGVNELKLSNYKTAQLHKYNEGRVDRIYSILDSDKTDKDKANALKILKNDTDKDLKDLMGKDYKKYNKLMDKELKPLKKKSKLLKHII